MTATLVASPIAPRIALQLKERQAELRALLQAAAAGAGEQAREVQDFKDVAAEETRVAIDEVTLSQAASELRQVTAARRRIEDGSYGACQDCGEPIAQRRLLAMPSTRFCTECQAIHERPAARR